MMSGTQSNNVAKLVFATLASWFDAMALDDLVIIASRDFTNLGCQQISLSARSLLSAAQRR